MDHTVDIPHTCSVDDGQIEKAISNYFKTHDPELITHLSQPLKRKIEESSGDSGENKVARNSSDLEELTQKLITQVLKEALVAKHDQESESESYGKSGVNRAKVIFYAGAASALSTITGVLVTYFAKQ